MLSQFSYAGITDKGLKREKNEDSWKADPELGLFVVSDGIGGEFAGDIASGIVTETLPELVREIIPKDRDILQDKIKRQLIKKISQLSNLIADKTEDQPGLTGMGATLVCAIIADHKMLVANMGDSRAYLLRDHDFRQLTKDHNLSQLLFDEGAITEEEFKYHPSKNRLIRFMGMPSPPIPEAKDFNLMSGDRVLLCSDGVTNMIDDDDLSKILSDKKKTPQEICDEIVKVSNWAGGLDNITAIVILIN